MSIFSYRRFVALICDPIVARRSIAAYLFLAAVVVVGFAASDTSETTAVRRGDFPAFWSMAVIANGSEPQRLYDIELQRQVQNAAWPSLAGELLPAAYPAQLAFAIQPLAQLDHRVARCFWTVASLVAACIAVQIFVRMNPRMHWAPWMVLGVLCVFGPSMRGIIGGQVLSFMMCLFALVVVLGRKSRLWADILLGVVLGLWLFKPYYALCVLAVPMLQRRWTALASFATVALLSWWLGAYVVGVQWVSEWIAFAQHFAQLNLDTNAHQMPNVWAQVYRLLRKSAVGDGSWWGALVAAYVVLGAGISVLLGRSSIRTILTRPREYGDLLFFLVPSIVVVAMPQVNFYDLGITACAVLALFRPERLGDRCFAGVCIFLSLFSTTPPLGLPLHFFLGLAGLGYVCFRARERVLIGP